MRLFDHMASGVPIVANSSCDQTSRFSESIDVCSGADEFVSTVQARLKAEKRSGMRLVGNISWSDRADEMLQVIQTL